jgi:hypothetical protein
MGHIQWLSFPQQSPHLFLGQAHILVHVLREDVEKEIESGARVEAAVLTRIGLHYFPFLAERTPLEGSSPFATSPHRKGHYSQYFGRRLQTSRSFSCSPSVERGRSHQLNSGCYSSEPSTLSPRVSPHADPGLTKLTSFKRGC